MFKYIRPENVSKCINIYLILCGKYLKAETYEYRNLFHADMFHLLCDHRELYLYISLHICMYILYNIYGTGCVPIEPYMCVAQFTSSMVYQSFFFFRCRYS